MKYRIIAGLALVMTCICSCDDNTDNIGSSLINNMDNLDVVADTFSISSQSLIADSVLSRNTIGYVGKVRDPETGAYITSDYMTQFHLREDFSFPNTDSIISKKDGLVVADSCELKLYYTSFFGDSLAPMKLTAYEMGKALTESEKYYSNYDPEREGLLRDNGIKINKLYTLTDLNVSEATRSESSYMSSISIKLDKEYTDNEGKRYDNFGTYIMRKYYEHPEYFKNSYQFTNHVVPGFYFKTQSGLGSMAYISLSQLNVYFKYKYKDKTSLGADTVCIGVGTSSFSGTEEVLQTTRIDNDKETMQRLAGEDDCTYLKTPAGLFTELTLPVNEIIAGHENDSINSAKVVLTRINNNVSGDYTLDVPQTLLLIPESEMYSFFEENRIADYKTSYLSSFNSTTNTYTFNNISNLIREMYNNGNRNNSNWNKVVIIPVTASYNTSSTVAELVKVTHDMSMTSTRLVKGDGSQNSKIRISVIYSKFR